MTITLTRDQLESARQKLALKGVILKGDTGEVSDDGVVLEFTYAEPTLTIEVKHKPMIFSESFVETKIRNWFNA